MASGDFGIKGIALDLHKLWIQHIFRESDEISIYCHSYLKADVVVIIDVSFPPSLQWPCSGSVKTLPEAHDAHVLPTPQ